MAEVSLDGTPLNNATPSSEWEMHAGIYRAFPAAGCIVHTHADACTALAALNRDLPPFHYMVVQFGGANVRCAPYVTFGTPALARHAVKALKDRTACLLANHGMILYARDTAQALVARAAAGATVSAIFAGAGGGKAKIADSDSDQGGKGTI